MTNGKLLSRCLGTSRDSTLTLPEVNPRTHGPLLRDDAELTSQIRCNGVVPSGQCVAVSKAERGDQMRFRFETGPILLSVQIGGHNQSGSGAGGANEVEHRFIAVQWLGSPVLGDL